MADTNAMTTYTTNINALITGTVVPPLLWSSVAYTTSLTQQYWQMGYMYAGSLAAYKTACMSVAGCDWLKWNGYDGMLFVVNFINTSSSPITLGYYSICFPNPVGGVSPKYATLFVPNTASGNFITQTCLGVAYTAITASTNAASRWTALTTLVPFYFTNDPTVDALTSVSLCIPSATTSGCSTTTVAISV